MNAYGFIPNLKDEKQKDAFFSLLVSAMLPNLKPEKGMYLLLREEKTKGVDVNPWDVLSQFSALLQRYGRPSMVQKELYRLLVSAVGIRFSKMLATLQQRHGFETEREDLGVSESERDVLMSADQNIFSSFV